MMGVLSSFDKNTCTRDSGPYVSLFLFFFPGWTRPLLGKVNIIFTILCMDGLGGPPAQFFDMLENQSRLHIFFPNSNFGNT